MTPDMWVEWQGHHATVDGHSVSYETDVEYVRVEPEHAVRPDPTWTHTDPAGHTHQWVDHDGMLAVPTVRRERVHRPCDGSCGGVCGGEGWDETVLYCTGCDAQVEPRFTPDTAMAAHGVPVGSTMRVTMKVQDPPRPMLEALFPAGMARKIEGAELVTDDHDTGVQVRMALPNMYAGGLTWSSAQEPVAFELTGEQYQIVKRRPRWTYGPP
jgi:hypothetical protein